MTLTALGTGVQITASEPPPLPWRDDPPEELDVAIIGGGFSGLITLVHLLRNLASTRPGAKLALLERRARPGPGVAYGACDTVHLLNVPAGRMGAFPEDPGAFHRWLESREPGRHAPGDFVSRALYGRYLLELAAAALRDATACGQTPPTLVRGAVVHLERLPTRVELVLASGATCVSKAVILAPGLPSARAPWVETDQGVPRHLLAADPWEAKAFAKIPPDAPVLIVGSGLTAVDVILALRHRGHRGRITMISRNGRLPLAHAAPGEPPATLDPASLLVAPRALLSLLRGAARARVEQGLGWQAVIDALRPSTTAIWRHWSASDRTRFLRRLRPFWEVHRHRAPIEVLQALESLRQEGRLELLRGSIARLDLAGECEVLAALRTSAATAATAIGPAPTANGPSRVLRVARVFNCVGPATGIRDTVDPLLGSLLRAGLATCDVAGLGFRTDEAGCLIGADGAPDSSLILVGALRRGELWESTAVPELRVQAQRAAAAAGTL